MLILLATKEWKDIDIYKVVQACAFNAKIGQLQPGESTDLLESRKLTKDELAIFDKILEAAAKTKS